MESADELHFVITGNAQGSAAHDHRVHQPQDIGRSRPTIHEVTDEDRAAPLRWNNGACPVRAIAELGEQRLQLVAAAVHIADDVERAALVARVRLSRPIFRLSMASTEPSSCT